jgi:hypothetical protein
VNTIEIASPRNLDYTGNRNSFLDDLLVKIPAEFVIGNSRYGGTFPALPTVSESFFLVMTSGRI